MNLKGECIYKIYNMKTLSIFLINFFYIHVAVIQQHFNYKVFKFIGSNMNASKRNSL